MKILQLTDTHLGIDRSYQGAPPGWRRANDHLAAMERALEPAFREEVDLVVHSGDVFDRSKPPQWAVVQCWELLERVARVVPVWVIAGNHDRHGLQRHLARPKPNLTVVDTPKRLEFRGLSVGLLPYQRFADEFGEAAKSLGQLDWLVCHQAFAGVEVPGGGGRPFRFHLGQRDTVGWPHLPKVPAVACGHIHPRQVVRVGEVPVVHPGSTERTAFSERRETKGYAIWEFSSAPSWSFIDLPTRAMRVVRDETALQSIAPGDLVSLRNESLREPVLARGAYVVPARSERAVRPATTQLGLFAAGMQ